MAKWLCCLACTTKGLCSYFGATRHGTNLDKLLTAVCLDSYGRSILTTCGIQQPLWLVSVYGELKALNGETLRQAGVPSRATARSSCRKNIGLSKLSPDSTLYRKIAERRGILSSIMLGLTVSDIRHVKIFQVREIIKIIIRYKCRNWIQDFPIQYLLPS
jgi:hypothetical protein